MYPSPWRIFIHNLDPHACDVLVLHTCREEIADQQGRRRRDPCFVMTQKNVVLKAHGAMVFLRWGRMFVTQWIDNKPPVLSKCPLHHTSNSTTHQDAVASTLSRSQRDQSNFSLVDFILSPVRHFRAPPCIPPVVSRSMLL